MPIFMFVSYLYPFISQLLQYGLTCTPKRTFLSFPQSQLPILPLLLVFSFILSIPFLSLTRFPSTFLLHLYISSSLSNCVVSMHLQVLLFLIDTKLDLVRITFTLNILRLQSEEKKKLLSQLYRTAMPSINNQQY